MIETAPSVSQLYAQAILQFAQRRGLSLPAGLRQQVQTRARVPLAVQEQLWEQYCQLADHPLAGLELGLALEVGHLDSVGMLLVSCDTLKDGFDALLEYAPVIGAGGSFRLRRDGSQLSLSYRPIYQVRMKERVEAVMASLLKLARWATGDSFQPEALCFSHAAATDQREYQQRLGIPVHFNHGENLLRFSLQQAELPLIQANPALRQHLQELADLTLERLGQHSLSTQVTHLVHDHPSWGRERIAASLALSGRHLNRLLAAEGLSFKILRERELHRMALSLLRQGLSVSATSEQLGFSEETAFVRAFRRWEGETPARYRECNLLHNESR